MPGSIGGQCHAKLATIYIAQNYFQKSGKNQCEYETVDEILYPVIDTLIVRRYEWVIESLTKIHVTVVVYNDDTVKENIPIGVVLTAIYLTDDTTIIV